MINYSKVSNGELFPVPFNAVADDFDKTPGLGNIAVDGVDIALGDFQRAAACRPQGAFDMFAQAVLVERVADAEVLRTWLAVIDDRFAAQGGAMYSSSHQGEMETRRRLGSVWI